MSSSSSRPRVLTGDTPTGRLHLGHWVGSVERRVAMQHDYDCYFLLANMHAFTTRSEKPEEIRQDTIEIVKDLGGVVTGIAMLVNRSDGTLDLGAPLFELIRLNVETFAPDNLPADLAATPAIKPGSK
jgi:hypothetical protein